MKESFTEFLQKKKEENSAPIDWQGRKNNWLNSIEKLYTDIRKWLKPFEEQGFLKIMDNKEIELNEEYIGKYKTKRLDIYLGNDIISLRPKGTFLLGACGRIDMRGTKGEILIVQNDWNIWKFVQPNSRLETWDVNAESLKKIIQELV